MRVERDYEELLALFNKHEVRYCIIGAFAVALHAKPRYTKDIDILVDPTAENAARVLAALAEFGFASLDLKVEDFSQPGHIIQLGYEPVRVDILTGIKGLGADIWEHRVTASYGQVQAFFIHLDDLIKAKQLSGRLQDQADLEILERARKKRDT